MKQSKYTLEEKRQHIIKLHSLKDKDPTYSIRRYACEHQIRYYTLRDWWRSEETNERWQERYSECPEPSWMWTLNSDLYPFVFVGGE